MDHRAAVLRRSTRCLLARGRRVARTREVRYMEETRCAARLMRSMSLGMMRIRSRFRKIALRRGTI